LAVIFELDAHCCLRLLFFFKLLPFTIDFGH
jgi:hypothetical protein